MNVRNYLKCDICETITLFRVQMGYLPNYPVRLYCGKCKTLITGMVFQNPDEGTYKFEFKNAKNISDIRQPDYYIEASGELLTQKLIKYDNDKHWYSSPPFFKSILSMNHEKFKKFRSSSLKFLYLIKNEWANTKCVYELWLNKKFDYLKNEIHKKLPEKDFPMNNQLEYLQGAHLVILLFFSCITDHSRFENNSEFIIKKVFDLSTQKTENYKNLIKYFSDNNLLNDYENKIFKQLDKFINVFSFLIPAYSFRFYENKPEDLFKKDGITTATFDDLKEFYIDTYEIITDIITLIIAYNNLEIRNDYTSMKSVRRDVNNLSEYLNKSKGIRINFIDGSELFDILIQPGLDNQIRNAIGHNAYEYDGINQIIKYYPKGIQTAENEKSMYLLEFAEKCWNHFLYLFDLLELIYQTQKINFMLQGIGPTR